MTYPTPMIRAPRAERAPDPRPDLIRRGPTPFSFFPLTEE